MTTLVQFNLLTGTIFSSKTFIMFVAELQIRNMNKLIFLTICLVFASCKSNETTQKDMVGKYKVHLELDQSSFNKQAVRDSINESLTKAKEELNKAHVEMEEDLSTAFIDTSTAEGKMEYFAKSFAKAMSSFGKDLGDLGIKLGEAAGDVAAGAMDFTETLLQKIQLDVELKSDSSIVSSSELVKTVQFVGSKWEVKGDTFYFKDDYDRVKSEYQILEINDKGFILGQHKYKLVFDKKPN